MAYEVPTLEEMLGFGVALFKGLLPTRNIGSRFAPAWKLVKTIAGVATDVHAHVASAAKDLMPTTAAGAKLDEHLFIWAPGGSKLRKGATPARKSAAGRVKGTVASTTTIGDQLIHRASGLLFQVNSAGVVPVGGFVDVDILAISTGASTRLLKGEVLEYLAPPPGIQTKVELQLDLDEDGYDQEQDGAARNRLLKWLSTPPAGGNQNDYESWALVQLGIAYAYAYPNRAGIGTVDIAALHAGTGTARKLNLAEATALQAAIALLAPAQVGAPGGSLRVLTTVEETANIEMTVTPDGSPQYAFDWDDSTPPTVVAWQPGGVPRKLQLSARPPSMQAGHRICLKGVASSQDSAPVVIESLSGADSVILQAAPKQVDGTDATPAATDIVYAGGPLTAGIRDAIIAHINGDVLYTGPLGPVIGAVAAATGISTRGLQLLAAGIGTANPAGVYGSWSGALVRATLGKIAMYTRGVRNQTLITPGADQDSTDYAFPNDAQIGFLVPGYVLVRRG